MRTAIALLLASCFLGSGWLPAQGVPQTAVADSIMRLDGTAKPVTEVDSTVTGLMSAAHVTGVGIILFRGGKVQYAKTYGMRDTAQKLPLTFNSVMPAASLSNAAFATMTMSLVEAKVLDLDKPVGEYLPKPLPQYPKYADLAGDLRYRKITLRMLLSHTSGLPNWRYLETDGKLHLHFDPGARFAYSGEGMDLAQLVVETVTAKPLTWLMWDKLFARMAMDRSSMVWDPKFESDFANGYDQTGRSLGPQRRTTADAAGSMQTTLLDYAALLVGILRGWALHPVATNMMLTSQIAIHSAHEFPSLATETTTDNDAIQLGYGLGWAVYQSPYGPAFFKEGHDDGWRHLALCFRNGNGILIMTNSSNGDGIFKGLLDSLLGPTAFPIDWEGDTPYNLLPPDPKLKNQKHKP